MRRGRTRQGFPPIPNRLRKYRRIMGYTQREVAKLLGIKSAGRISQWENGERFPGIKNLIKLSILYRTLIDHLYYDLREVILRDFESRQATSGVASEDQKNRPP